MNHQRMFAYDDWANREEAARFATHPHARAEELFAHIIGTEWTWLARLRGEPSRMAVWPSNVDYPRELDALRDAWSAYLATASLEDVVEYTNSKGERYSSTVDDILTHVVLHGSYHRGQIATVLRGAELEPAYTDYIHCVRSAAVLGGWPGGVPPPPR